MTRARDRSLVRKRRDELGLTLHELGGRIGRPASLLNMVEGGFVPKERTMRQIAQGLETTPEALWPDEFEVAS